MMNQVFSKDIDNCITALEDYIITWEDALVIQNASDKEWEKMKPYKNTLNNMKFLKSIYGT